MWYAEADDVSGPWRHAVKVASHPRYSFYNPVHHAFLDAEGGRVIYFQGTYSLEFSGNPLAPARYDYNQVMYRLDLSDKRLAPAQARRSLSGLGKKGFTGREEGTGRNAQLHIA